jgi:hypothetical protein
VHAEEAEIVAGAQARHQQALLRLRGGGLFDDGIHAVQIVAAGHAASRHRAKARQQALASRLHAADRAGFGLRQFHQVLGRCLAARRDVEVIAHHMQERVRAGELARAPDGVAVAARFRLCREVKGRRQLARGLGVAGFVARPYHHADLFDFRGQRLFDEDAEQRLLRAVAIHQGLQRERALGAPGGGNDGFTDSQVDASMGSVTRLRHQASIFVMTRPSTSVSRKSRPM